MCTLLYLAKLSGLVECCPLKGQWPNPAAMLRIVCLTEFWCLWNNLHKYVGIVDSLKKKARELRGGRRNLLYRQRLLWKASEKRCLQYWTIQLNLWTQRKYKKKIPISHLALAKRGCVYCSQTGSRSTGFDVQNICPRMAMPAHEDTHFSCFRKEMWI